MADGNDFVGDQASVQWPRTPPTRTITAAPAREIAPWSAPSRRHQSERLPSGRCFLQHGWPAAAVLVLARLDDAPGIGEFSAARGERVRGQRIDAVLARPDRDGDVLAAAARHVGERLLAA